MSKKRRQFSNELKFTIVMEALKGQHQISEIAAEYNVHPPDAWRAGAEHRPAIK